MRRCLPILVLPFAIGFSVLACRDSEEQHPELATSHHAVVGGAVTTEYPDVAFITSGCTATLIHPQAVLTASHCCQSFRACKIIEIGGEKIGVQKIITNPEFSNSLGDSGKGITPSVDVAILVLSTPVVGITPRKIAKGPPVIDKPIRFVGFGCNTFDDDASDNGFGTKRTGTNTIAFFGTDADGKDAERFKNVFGWRSAPNEAGVYPLSDSNICPGDSGGPTFWEEDGVEVVAGVHTLVGPLFGYSTIVSGASTWINAQLPPCVVGAAEKCGECGESVCQDDFTWSACGAPATNTPRACGESKTQACGTDGKWGVCQATPLAEDVVTTEGCGVQSFASRPSNLGIAVFAVLSTALALVRRRRRANA